MGRKGPARLRRLADELRRAHPALEDPESAIARGDVLVDGLVVVNPATLVRAGAAISLRSERLLRGEAKLTAALAAFAVDARDRVALDVGAAAGGFTRALLSAGARRVYAVDAGYGQLLGSLRQDERVVNLERTNLATLEHALVPERIELVTLDLSYLSIRAAVPQLAPLDLAPGCELVALVKPQFELGRASLPRDESSLARAVDVASAGIAAAGWTVVTAIRSPHPGTRGAIEFFVHARREKVR